MRATSAITARLAALATAMGKNGLATVLGDAGLTYQSLQSAIEAVQTSLNTATASPVLEFKDGLITDASAKARYETVHTQRMGELENIEVR